MISFSATPNGQQLQNISRSSAVKCASRRKRKFSERSEKQEEAKAQKLASIVLEQCLIPFWTYVDPTPQSLSSEPYAVQQQEYVLLNSKMESKNNMLAIEKKVRPSDTNCLSCQVYKDDAKCKPSVGKAFEASKHSQDKAECVQKAQVPGESPVEAKKSMVHVKKLKYLAKKFDKSVEKLVQDYNVYQEVSGTLHRKYLTAINWKRRSLNLQNFRVNSRALKVKTLTN